MADGVPSSTSRDEDDGDHLPAFDNAKAAVTPPLLQRGHSRRADRGGGGGADRSGGGGHRVTFYPPMPSEDAAAARRNASDMSHRPGGSGGRGVGNVECGGLPMRRSTPFPFSLPSFSRNRKV